MKTHCGTKSLSHYNSGNPRFEAQSSLRSERKSSGESGGGQKTRVRVHSSGLIEIFCFSLNALVMGQNERVFVGRRIVLEE